MKSYTDEEREFKLRFITATPVEQAAIDAIKVALKALPKTVYMSVDESDGLVEFWRPVTPGRAYRVDKFRRKAAFTNNKRRR